MVRFLILFLLISFPALAQDNETLSDLTGIPIMEGLAEVEDARLYFDKPEGRIIHLEFESERPADQVLIFYGETLSQLGWELEGGNDASGETIQTYIRDEEQLVLSVSKTVPLTVTLEVGPGGGKAD